MDEVARLFGVDAGIGARLRILAVVPPSVRQKLHEGGRTP